MIAADTSTWIAYLQSASGTDAALLDRALLDQAVVMVPAVLAELLSDPQLDENTANLLLGLPLLDLLPGYWERSGRLRARLLAARRRARLADSLIAQCCLDHGMPLISRDHDFKTFARAAGLNLLLA